MKRTYNGTFAEYIVGLIEQKKAMGYDYSESEYTLSTFERFCSEHFPGATELNQEIALKWAEIKDSERERYQLNRISAVRELARYMNSIGVAAYIIPLGIHRKNRRDMSCIHIYTNEELAAIFRAADTYPQKAQAPAVHLVVTVIFRLIYCCGLRPVEARRLRVEDVDLDSGCVKILESKGHRDRIVVMADDVLALARKYNERVSFIFPNRPFFFPNRTGNGQYSTPWINYVFRELLSSAGLPGPGCDTYRLYNLRHTFATHRLYQWLQEGENINDHLAYLSEYMGHTRLSTTSYYFHLVPEFYPQMAKLGFETRDDILPEVPV